MFCLGCGAEAPLRAIKCPICGRDLGRNDSEVRYTSSVVAAASMPPAGPAASYPGYAPPARTPALPGAVVTGGGLDMPGLPRDAQGRAVLVTAIAMAVDLLVPWVVVDGTHRPVASVGAPVLAALPVLGAALVPLFNPALRRKPVYAALPMIVGALCVGAGGMLWMLLTYFSYQYSIGVPTGPISSGLLIPSAFGATPDVGMYLFILGGAVLIFTGYRLFLEAASGMRSDAAPAPIGVAPAFVPPPLAIPVYPALVPASVPLAGSTSQPLPGVTMDGVNGQPSTPLLPYTQQAAPPGAAQRSGPISPISPMSPSSATSDGAQPDGANAAAHNGALHVPLPGSAEWNEAPRQPEHMRPALGWQRGPRVRR